MDVCPSCGGLWLDKGELEKLSQSEERYYGGERGRDYDRSRRDDDDDDDRGFGGLGGQRGGGFLGNLFGGMGGSD
jgi:Zn-finger nucleic acid-binding protein